MSKNPVTKRAVLQRINRKLAPEGFKLVKKNFKRPPRRPDGWPQYQRLWHLVGQYYLINERQRLAGARGELDGLMMPQVDLESFAREQGVLAESETLE